MTPADLRYTAEHEWVRVLQGQQPPTVRLGITDFAQQSLGDIVFVTLPEAGAEVGAGQPLGEVESTKSVSEVYSPVTGEIVTRNDALDTQPELINADPYGEGWLVEIKLADPDGLDAVLAGLMDAAAYDASVSG